MPKIQAVIFDIDDTLYPERAYTFSGFAAVAKAFAARLGDESDLTARMQRLFDTEHRPRVFDALLEQIGLGEDAPSVAEMIRVFRNHAPTIALRPDADRALARLRGAYRLGLITDGPAVQQRAKITALGLEDRLDHIVVTAEIGEACGKPNPVAFLRMAKSCGVKHESCMYVADNQAKDFVAPNVLGWLTVRLVSADGIYRDAPAAAGGKAANEISSLDELDSLLV